MCIRPRGYAMDNEENEPGIVCYGVALRDKHGSSLQLGVGTELNLTLIHMSEPTRLNGEYRFG